MEQGYGINFENERGRDQETKEVFLRSCNSFIHQRLLFLELSIISWVHTGQLEYFLRGEWTHRRVSTPATPAKQCQVQR